MNRRIFSAQVALMLGATFACVANAQNYPNKPITIVLASATGGASDTLARMAGEAMQKAMGQPVVVISRPGAGGSIGVESVVRAPADGYTFLLTTSGNLAINPHVYKLNYDPIAQLTQVSILVDVPFVLVANKDSGPKDLKTLIAAAKQKPGQLMMGNAGLGTHQHLTQLIFAKTAGIDMRLVPYKGSIPATIDLMGGHIETIIDNVGVQKPLIESGKVHPILTTALTRIAALPNVPTAQELGLQFSSVAWFGLAAPKGTPAEIIKRVQVAISATFSQPEVRQKLIDGGMIPLASTPEFANERVAQDAEKFGKLAKDFDLKLE
jgi:tripartite-type tricarboxylate transporter receptor subunit TctC